LRQQTYQIATEYLVQNFFNIGKENPLTKKMKLIANGQKQHQADSTTFEIVL